LAWCSSCSSRVLERLRFDPFGQLFLAGRSLADCPPGRRGPSARHQLLADRPRTRRGPSVIRGALLEVLLRFSDCPLEGRGPAAPASRTVRLGFRRVAKSFTSLVSLSLWDCLGVFLGLVGPL
jgi:hypothetical protein